MCGILGQINKNKNIDENTFRSMLKTLEKRGPDQEGCFFDGQVALGHKRLSILDLSESGRQPMMNKSSSLSIVYNGEIYNHQNIKNQIESCHQWKSRTDTEVILHGYEEYGSGIVEKIEGMFALAIYDKNKNTITLARDHFGKKPLYYFLDEEIFCFASELKALLKNTEIKKKIKIDKLSLEKYLIYGYIPSPHSIYDQIKKLEPATVLEFDIKSWKIKNKKIFWRPENIKINNGVSEGEIIKKTEELLLKSVEKRLMSDVPIGIFLSGGVDSSLVAHYMSKFSRKANAFTVSYDNYKINDELEYAGMAAKKIGMNHAVCHFQEKETKEIFLEIFDYLDEPLADAAVIPLYFLSKQAKEKITVALSGDGGDEIFGGYPKYKAQNFIEKYFFLKSIAPVAKYIFPSGSAYRKFMENFSEDFAVRQFVFGSGGFSLEEAGKILKNQIANGSEIFQEAYAYDAIFTSKDDINRSLFLDTRIQLPDWYLVKSDRAGMSNSLEIRNPFLDKSLAEFAMSLGGGWKIRNGESKYVLKKIAEKYMDKKIIHRPKKGFGVPLEKWIRDDFRELFSKYLFLENGYFENAFVKKLYQEHMSGKADHQFRLLRIFGFNYWYSNFHQ